MTFHPALGRKNTQKADEEQYVIVRLHTCNIWQDPSEATVSGNRRECPQSLKFCNDMNRLRSSRLPTCKSSELYPKENSEMTRYYETNRTDEVDIHAAALSARGDWFRRLFGSLVSEETSRYITKPNPLVMQGLHISCFNTLLKHGFCFIVGSIALFLCSLKLFFGFSDFSFSSPKIIQPLLRSC